MTSDNSILIYGASDDRVVVEGMIENDYDLTGDKWRAEIVDAEGNYLLVTVDYTGWWEVTVSAPADGGFPEWRVQFCERPYETGDPAVRIWAPEDAELRLVSDFR